MSDIGSDRSRSGYKRPRMDRGTSAIQNQSAQVTSQTAVDQAHQHDRVPPGRHKARRDIVSSDYPTAHSGVSPLPQQHPLLSNAALPGCIVRQDFSCVVLSDVLGQEGVEQCLSFHPNGLAVVQLAPTHPAVREGETDITEIDFGAGGCNVLESAVVKGKKKKGALQLHPTTVLCSVKTRDGKKYKVCTGISGELIQANKALVHDPGIMSAEPLGRGWLIIVRLKPRDLRRLQEAVGFVEER